MSDNPEQTPGEAGPIALRIDKWLWCARFFKTRSQAQTAVEGGRVQVNGDRVKASRAVRVGDRLRITRERERLDIDVRAIPVRRGPAPEARTLYEETPESGAARAQAREMSRLTATGPSRRPDRRERRQIRRVVRQRDT